MVHECNKEEENLDDALHYILEYINNSRKSRDLVGCSIFLRKSIELVKRFLLYSYPKLMFG